jgi:predicted cupin superfamily sugar epimerase
MLTPEKLIEHLGLERLPVEGGYFRQTYCAEEAIPRHALPDRYPTDKPFSTAIYYLLTSDPDSFSALHKLPTEEVYHFYLGDPVELLLLYPDGGSERVILGPRTWWPRDNSLCWARPWPRGSPSPTTLAVSARN